MISRHWILSILSFLAAISSCDCLTTSLPPKDVAGTVKGIREAVQAALQQRQSRMILQLPPSSRFGVEGKSAGQQPDSSRELARLLVEMFQPLGDNLVVGFHSEAAARTAKEVWAATRSTAKYKGSIVSIMSEKKSKMRSKPRGFGAGPPQAAAVEDAGPVPSSSEVLLVVAPELPELPVRLVMLKDMEPAVLLKK